MMFTKGDTLHHVSGATGTANSSGSVNSDGIPIVSVRMGTFSIPWDIATIAAVERNDVIVWERDSAPVQLGLFDDEYDPYFVE